MRWVGSSLSFLWGYLCITCTDILTTQCILYSEVFYWWFQAWGCLTCELPTTTHLPTCSDEGQEACENTGKWKCWGFAQSTEDNPGARAWSITFEHPEIRVWATSPPLAKSTTLGNILIWLLPGCGQSGLRAGSPDGGGRNGYSSPPSALTDRLKKKNLPIHNWWFPFASQRRKHGLFPAVSRGHQNPAHRECVQHPSNLQQIQDLAFSQMLTPHPISSKSNIYTNLGGSSRAGIYIQVALGTKQKLGKCFLFEGFLNSLTEV